MVTSAIKKGYAKLFNKGKQISEFLQVPEYYDSIDSLPVLNWHKVKETGDFKWLLKSKGNIALLDVDGIWYKIEEEFFNEFGVTDDFKTWWKLETEYHILMAKSYIENDNTYRTFAHVAKAEADGLLKDIQGGSFNESVAIVSKYMGCQINPAKTSVREFHSYLQLMKRG